MAAALSKEDMRCVHVIVLLSFIKLSIINLISVLNAIDAQIVLTCIIPTSSDGTRSEMGARALGRFSDQSSSAARALTDARLLSPGCHCILFRCKIHVPN